MPNSKKDTLTYTSPFAKLAETLGFAAKSIDNHGNKSNGTTIVCRDGVVVERTSKQFEQDVRAIDAAARNIDWNPLDGTTFSLDNLPSPLQTRCQDAARQQGTEAATER